MYYYVVFRVIPDDYMGSRVKIMQFDNIIQAMEVYKNVFSKVDQFLAEIKELYCWDEEEIERANEEDYCLNALGDIYLYKTELNISEVSNLTCDCGEPVSYGIWINDFDDLALDQCCISLLEFIESNDFDLICSYSFEFYGIEDSDSDYSMNYVECLDSIDEARQQLLEEGYTEM